VVQRELAKTLEIFISINIKIEDDILFRGFKIKYTFPVSVCHICYQASTGYLFLNILYIISRQKHKLQEYKNENFIT